MSRIWGKRPSPALLISMLALFVALGGSAYAATKIGTKNIKANAITAGKIKKNAVTSAKIKKEAVTGSKIKESTLGPVPNATNATNAVNATNFSRYFTSGLVRASAGQNVALYNVGPFSMVGHCKDTGGGNVEAVTILTTNQAKSAMASYEDDYYEFEFDPGDEAEVGSSVNNTTPEVGDYGYYDYTGFSAESADGATLIRGNASNAVHVFGAQCAFWLSATKIS
jgi:hypothetical protein